MEYTERILSLVRDLGSGQNIVDLEIDSSAGLLKGMPCHVRVDTINAQRPFAVLLTDGDHGEVIETRHYTAEKFSNLFSYRTLRYIERMLSERLEDEKQ